MTAAEKTLRVAKARQLAASGTGRMLRQAAQLNGYEVARAIDVDPSTLWRWENRQRKPQGRAAIRYADFLEKLGG